jgi:hypothetical protein
MKNDKTLKHETFPTKRTINTLYNHTCISKDTLFQIFI